MDNRNKRLWLAMALLLVLPAGAVGGWMWWLVAHAPPAQIITLPNGERYQFAGVTYGTNPVPPSLLIRLGNLLPARMAKRAGWPQYNYPIGLPYYFYFNRPTDRPELRVWFKRLGTNAPPFSSFSGRLADQNGVEAGVMGYFPIYRSANWTCLDFPAVPRRSREIQCNLYQVLPGATAFASPRRIGSVRFANPLRGQYPQWQPEPAHMEKKAGDIGAKIDDLMVSVERDETVNTKVDVSLDFPAALNDEWVVHDVVLSDATGNSLRSGLMSLNPLPLADWQWSRPNTFNGSTQGTLWPGETAWRVKVELKHTTGYTPTELVMFTNVTVPPPGPTNTCRLTNTTGGILFVLTATTMAVTFGGPVGPSGMTSGFEYELHLEMPGKPPDMAVDLITAESDQGKLRPSTFFNGETYAYDATFMPFGSSTPVTNMNLTFAVQKTRSVEFLVKPPKE